MEPSAEAIIEEIIDPLMMGGLSQSFPNIELRRRSSNVVEVDYGTGVYTVTVEPQGSDGGGHQGHGADDLLPDEGTITVQWTVTTIQNERRLGWSYQSHPDLDPGRAIVLLRDVASELEEDLP